MGLLCSLRRATCAQLRPNGRMEQAEIWVLTRDADSGRRLAAELSDKGIAAQHGVFQPGGLEPCLAILPRRADSCAEIRALRRCGLKSPLLVIGELSDGARLLHAGADALLPEGASARELVALVRALLRRSREALSSGRDGAFLSPLANMGQLKLTPTEQRILEVLARRPGRVVTRDLILDTLYAGADAPRSSTVDVFVHGLRRKLDGDTGLRIETVRGAGFRLAIA